MKNKLLYLFALLWCSQKNRKKLREYKGWSPYLRDCAMGEHGLVKSSMDGENLLMYVAKHGKKLGMYGEWVAYIADLNFHVLSANDWGEDYEKFWRTIERLGLEYEYDGENDACKWYRVKESFQNFLFWYKRDVPKGCKSILLMSNGSIVKGYWRRYGNTIEIYRPNPNAWEVYNPVEPSKIGWKTWRIIQKMLTI